MSGSSTIERPGQFLGTERFVVQQKLGEGSMGAVYLAYDQERKARVALKTLRRVDASGIYRFKREFRALTDVHHRNLVGLYELFVEGDEWFFTMEYVPGVPFLDHVLGEHRPATPYAGDVRATRELRVAADEMGALFQTPMRDDVRLRGVMSQIAEGLMAVHAAGQLHRDLKPDNVLVTPDGRAVVLDFGIAVERVEDGLGTLDAGVMGTPAYMSPEQAAGGSVDEGTDWYAFGVMLFEALTSQVPFDGAYLEVLRSKQRVDPPAPSTLCSGIPEDLDALCLALLQRDPSHRPAGEEVLLVLGGEATAGRPSRDDASPFVGRDEQLQELRRALQRTDEGKTVVAFVQGATGMGKSAMVEHFVRGLSDDPDTVVLRGRCYEREAVPFKAFDSLIDTLSRYLRSTAVVATADVMPRDIEALAQLFPVLRRVEVVNRIKRRHRLPNDPHEVRRRAFGALRELLVRLSHQRRLVIYVDDLQWGDVDSARLITELISGHDAPAMLLVCTYRSGDVHGSPCLQTLFEHTRESTDVDIRQLNVGPLSNAEIEQLAEYLLVDDPDADLAGLAREARGNPYMLTELLEHYRRRQSDRAPIGTGQGVSLDDALSERLGRLPQGPASMLELIAVSGRPLRESILSALATPELNLHDTLQVLRDERLVRGVGSSDARALEIYHGGIRQAVLARMAPELVRNWHRRLADALEASGSTDLQALTEHLIGAEDFSRAGIHAIRAAVQATRTLAFDKAARLYELAVQYNEDEDAAWQQELRVHWGEALVNAGRSGMAAEVLLQAAQHADGADVCALERRAGTAFIQAGDFTRGYSVLQSSLSAYGISLSENAGQAVSRTLLLSERLRARGLGYTPCSEQTLTPQAVERLDAGFEIQRALILVQPVRAMPLVAEHLYECLDCGEPRRIAQAACAYYISVESTLGRAQRALGSLQLAESLAHELIDPRTRAEVAMARGWHYQSRGMFSPAILHLTQAEELFRNRCQGRSAEMRLCRQMLGRLYQQTGRLSDLRNVEQWAREAEEREDRVFSTHLRLLTILATLMDDDVERATRVLRQTEVALQEQRFGFSTILLALADIQLTLYSGDARSAGGLPHAYDADSPLWEIEPFRSDLAMLRAQLRVLSALGAEAPYDEEARVDAEASLAKLASYERDYYADHARLVRAALAHQRGNDAEAVRILEAILGDREQAGDGPIVLACARLRRGQLLGAEGITDVERARLELSGRGVNAPDSFVNLYAPGFRFE